MHRASLRNRAFDPWPRAAQPWTTQDADAMRSGKTLAYLLNTYVCESRADLRSPERTSDTDYRCVKRYSLDRENKYLSLPGKIN